MDRQNIPVHHMHMVKVIPRFRRPTLRRTFIRAWRLHRDLTLEQLADRLTEAHSVPMTHASLSRIERGMQPYSQPILEALAEELTGGDVASLLMRSPDDPEGLWSIWDQAEPAQRQQIVAVAQALTRKAGAV